jgi:cytoskeletal protein RodZ
MEREHFGSFLRKQREARGMSLAELSRATKIKESNLQLLVDAALDALPARVFVVGYIGAYARAVGADESEAMARLKLHAPDSSPPHIGDCMKKVVARVEDETGAHGKLMANRKVGVALVVFLLLIVATLTLSLLLRHGGHAGGAMS